MELIFSLIKLLTPDQLKELITICKATDRAEYKLLLLYLKEEKIDAVATPKKLGLTAATFNKTQTNSKDVLINYLKQFMQAPDDKVVLVQRLLMIGENKSAIKLYNSLEKELEQHQAWNMMELLYIEGFRIAQILGDMDMIHEVAAKRSKNIDRLRDSVHVYGKVMIEMLSVERFEKRKEDPVKYLARVEQIYSEAVASGHHVMIHNALTTLYNIYARYFNEPEKTWDVIQRIKENRETYKLAMNPLTAAVSKITNLNFLCIYAGFESPEEHIADCLSTIHLGGDLAKVNVYYALTGYYLTEYHLHKAEEYLQLIEKIEDSSKFKQYRAIVMAIKSFLGKDWEGFESWYVEFYSDPTHIDFPDMECMLRILELISLLRADEILVYQSRLAALRVYMNRNLNKTRYSEEHQIVGILATGKSAKNKKILEELNQYSFYRNIRLLSQQLLHQLYR